MGLATEQMFNKWLVLGESPVFIAVVIGADPIRGGFQFRGGHLHWALHTEIPFDPVCVPSPFLEGVPVKGDIISAAYF